MINQILSLLMRGGMGGAPGAGAAGMGGAGALPFPRPGMLPTGSSMGGGMGSQLPFNAALLGLLSGGQGGIPGMGNSAPSMGGLPPPSPPQSQSPIASIVRNHFNNQPPVNGRVHPFSSGGSLSNIGAGLGMGSGQLFSRPSRY